MSEPRKTFHRLLPAILAPGLILLAVASGTATALPVDPSTQHDAGCSVDGEGTVRCVADGQPATLPCPLAPAAGVAPCSAAVQGAADAWTVAEGAAAPACAAVNEPCEPPTDLVVCWGSGQNHHCIAVLCTSFTIGSSGWSVTCEIGIAW